MQLDDTIERLDTVNVGMPPDRAAPVAEAELLGLDELGDVELGDVELGDVELGDVEAELALRSSVPVTRTLWFTCALRSTDEACARSAYDVPPIALEAELDGELALGVEVDGAVELALVSPSFCTFVRMY